jgi:hypothetical protein
MPTYSSLRDAIKNRVESVANTGPVYGRERVLTNWEDFLNAYSSTFPEGKLVRGWFLALDTIQDTNSSFAEQMRTYTWVIHGIQAVKDSADSEGMFMGLVEEILTALATSSATLQTTGVYVHYWGPVSMAMYQVRQFGSTLCHYCEINFPVSVGVSV